MKITAIKVYQVSVFISQHCFVAIFCDQVDLPLVDGSYKWADGKSVGIYDSTVVALHTDAGIVG